MKRYPIESGTVMKVNGVSIQVDEYIGEGSTCLVYNGRVLDSEALIPDMQVIIKEFYPKSSAGAFDITRNPDGTLYVSEDIRRHPEYKDKRKQFESGLRMQKQLANSKAMEVMVKPFLTGDYGDTSYLVSDIHMGKSLDKVMFETLKDKLSCAIRVAEVFGILHQSGYMMLDFKPENLLWTEQPKSVKLIDADSIFAYKNTSADYIKDRIAADVGEEDVFYVNPKYNAPEILLLKRALEQGQASLSEKKSSYFVPNVNVYNVGWYLFELLFDRGPSGEDGEFSENLSEELYRRYKTELGNKKMAENLLVVLRKSLQSKCGKRYRDGSSLVEGLNACMEEITSRKFMPKRTVAKANDMYLSYNLLEKYPLYEYSQKEDSTTILDIAVVGTYSIRESLLKVVISCGQMLDSVLNIRLIAEDAETFWEYYKSKECNPELGRTVQWFINGKPFDNSQKMKNAEIVESPLANIYLYTDDSDENIARVIKENNTAYIVFAYGQEETDCKKAESLVKALPRKKHFVGYLSGEQELQVKNKDRIEVYPIQTGKVSDKYNEQAYKSHIYYMGMSVHEYYYRGSRPRASKAEIREDYAKDFYNIESSERCVLHANYKLKSIGIDPASAKAPYLYYEKVLNSKSEEAKELFDKLAALEHRSWTAFLVLSGVRAVDDAKTEIAQYAYAGKSDWKKRDESGRIASHPCLKASRPGRNLIPDIWEEKNKEKKKKKLMQLDPLDKRSLEIYDAICSVVEEKGIKKAVDQNLAYVENYLDDMRTETVDTAYNILCSSKEKVFERETNSEELWHQAVEEFTEICQNEGIFSDSLKEKISDIQRLIKPVLWCIEYHDFKSSDEDMLYALPRILIQNSKIQHNDAKITIIRPMAKEMWKNLYSSIVTRADCLILVPFNGEEKQPELLERYSARLKACKADTQVQIKMLNQLRNYGGKNGQVFIDETGVDPEYSRALAANPYMKDTHKFKVEGRELKPTDNSTLISLFNRPVNLTVQETLALHGAEMISEKMPDYIVGLSTAEYKSLWNLYRELGGKKWKIFIDELKQFEDKEPIALGNAGEKEETYESGYAEANILRAARIDNILAKLSAHGFVSSYMVPKENAYGKVRFKTRYQNLGKKIEQMILQAVEEPLRHTYQIEFEENQVIISDDSLYVSGVIPHEQHETIKEVGKGDNKKQIFRDGVMDEVCSLLLEEKKKDKVLQNFQCKSEKEDKEKNSQYESEGGKGKRISFRYASKAVKEVLRKEGSLLEALIFHECRVKKVFDDIRVNVEFEWPGNRTRNEIDIIGTKNSKTYFISAKMKKPDKMHIYEVQSLCDRFSVEGHAVLVSSHYTTGVNEGTGERSYAAVEDRAEDMWNMSGNMSYIGKNGVDKTGEIVIGSTIAEIVEQGNQV